MLRVSRPAAEILVLSEGRAQALVRLLIWIGIVVLFCVVLLVDSPPGNDRPPDDPAAAWRTWALFLVPLFLLPYLFALIRAIRRGDDLVINGLDKIVFKGGKTLAAFTEVRAIELQTIHGSCEEFRLSALLAAGGAIPLLETGASAAVQALAREISELMDVPLVRSV